MKITTIKNLLITLLLAGGASAFGQVPVISSFGQNGVLICTNLERGTPASVEWAPSLQGPWTNTWSGLDAVMVDSNGTIQVSVPMFYRVRGVARTTNPPPASMAMGDTLDGDTSAQPTHTVNVSAFYMDKYEVTKALWDEVYNWAIANGYSFDNTGLGKASTHPVQTVSWYDAVKWCNARSEKEGRTPAYYTDSGLSVRYRTGQVAPYVNWNSGYRLPTEAEWEKAARGGSSGQRFPWGNTITHSQANYYSSSNDAYDISSTRGYHPSFSGVTPYTSPVGYFAANGYGLYDMVGNIWEWCWDWYGSYSSASQTDPRGPASGSPRVFRGGSWNYGAIYCRAADRTYADPTCRGNGFGFRSVLPSGQQKRSSRGEARDERRLTAERV